MLLECMRAGGQGAARSFDVHGVSGSRAIVLRDAVAAHFVLASERA